MSSYIRVPMERLQPEVLQNLLEEYASRDGTDYGAVELTLEQKTDNLRRQLHNAELVLLYQTESEQWDLLTAEQAEILLED